MRTVIVIQARMSSTRLPGKVLLPLAGKPLLVRMVERVKQARLADLVVVATTRESVDDKIERLCVDEGILCYRGHATDLLDRHYHVALCYRADVILKIPSDCPLISPAIIDQVIQFYKDKKDQCDYVSNLHPASYPDGNDVELMTFAALEKSWKNAFRHFEREHTTPYIWENPELFRIGTVLWDTGKDYSKSHRWTIDYPEDYAFIKRVYEELYMLNKHFDLNDILQLIKSKPVINTLNNKYAGEYWYKNHADELKTISYQR